MSKCASHSHSCLLSACKLTEQEPTGVRSLLRKRIRVILSPAKQYKFCEEKKRQRNHSGFVLCKQTRSIPSAPTPILVNLGSWLTEQKLIHRHVLFVYPPPPHLQQGAANQRSLSLALRSSHRFPGVAPNWRRTFLIHWPRWRELQSLDGEQADVLMPRLTLSVSLARFPLLSESPLSRLFFFPFVSFIIDCPPSAIRPLSLHHSWLSVFLPGLSLALISCWFLWASCTSYQPDWLHCSNALLSAGD